MILAVDIYVKNNDDIIIAIKALGFNSNKINVFKK